MLQFKEIEKSSYRIYLKKNTKADYTMDEKQYCFKYINECCHPKCVYTRTRTNMRERFENFILRTNKKKTGLNILFYGSFLLYQELKLVLMLNSQLTEIHFTDYAYKNLLTNQDHTYINVFTEFMEYISARKLNTKVYIHSDPDKLNKSIMFHRRLDIICGIDIDYVYDKNNNRSIMKEIARNMLNIDGVMYMSQHDLVQVDLCCYEISNNNSVILVSTEDFVKPNYYTKYWIKNFFNKIYYPISIIGLLGTLFLIKKSPILAIIASTYYVIDILYKYLLDWDNPVSYKKKITKFSSLLKI
jgi:hypothetical protein